MKLKLKRTLSLLTMLVIMVCSMVPSSADSVTISREYTKYVVATGQTSTYTLSLTSSNTNSRAVIGTDDRVRQTRHENDGIVSLSSGGTGFIVDDHTIATAAHCVYDGNDFLSTITIDLYSETGVKQVREIPIVEMHIPTEWIERVEAGTQNTDSGIVYDYALVTVATDLSERTHFSLTPLFNRNDSKLANLNVYVTGVPAMANGNDNGASTGYLYTGVGRLKQNVTYPYTTLYFTTDTSGGNSGGPVYLIQRYNDGTDICYEYSVIGIVHGGDSTIQQNTGAMITPYLLQFYYSNSNASY